MVDFTGGTWRSLIDGSEVAAIPDSAENHWGFEEGSGTLVSDGVGDFDADFNNLAWGEDGYGGVHGILDGTDDFGELGDGSESHWSHWINNGEGFFATWINPDSVSETQTLFGTGASSDGNSVSIRIEAGGDIRALAGDDISPTNIFDITATDVLVADAWQAVGVSADGSSLKIFVDDIEEASGSIDDTTTGDLGSTINIGRRNTLTDQYYGGRIDEPWTRSSANEQNYLDWYADTAGRY